MKKMFRAIVVFSFLAVLASPVLSFAQQQQQDNSLGREYTFGQVVGSMVKNQQGIELGRIADIVLDSNGHVPFVIVSHGGVFGMGGKQVAVPFSALNYDKTNKSLIVNIDQAKFNSAPAFTADSLSNPQFASEQYRYFGQQPYWTNDTANAQSSQMQGSENLNSK